MQLNEALEGGSSRPYGDYSPLGRDGLDGLDFRDDQLGYP